MAEHSLPLHGVVVVEFSTSVAGPFAGQILADLGAEVFKVENPQGGDDARLWGPPFIDGVSPVFQALNRNKRSLAVDLKDNGDRMALAAFIEARVDIVVQNLRPGLIERYHLDEKTLRDRKPELIYCNISAFGATGPKRMQPGYDPLMQACGGIMSTTGVEGQDPVRVGPSIVDQGAGMWSAIAIQSALLARMKSGQGCTIDASLYETAISWLQPQIANYLASGKVPRRLGTENAGIAPYKAFKASDGWLVIAAGNDNLFARLAKALERESWLQDLRFTSNPKRVEHRVALNDLIQGVIETDQLGVWIERLQAAGVPVAPILSIDEVLKDPQFSELGLLCDVPESQSRLLALPLSFDGVRPEIRSGPPALGDATRMLNGYRQAGDGN
jgi:crotonobetainyl-CoA:carnitine CoA-transferase CaiB-like acyl-CoA transferase